MTWDASNWERPRVSVIIIFHNAEDYLEEAITSVLMQSYRDFELLLADDGSTDGGSEMALRHANREPARIRYLEHARHANRGMSATRNLGLTQARGEFVGFIDADDRWRPNKLSEQVTLLESHPEIAAVFGAVNYWRSWAGGDDELVATGHVNDRPISPPRASLALYPLGRAPAPCPSDLVIRRDIALTLGGFEESFIGPLQMYEDQAFFAKLYLSHKVYFASSCWLDYRRHARSCTESVTRDGRYDGVRRHFLEWFEAYLTERPKEERAVMDAVQRALLPYRRPYIGRPLRAAGNALRRLGIAPRWE